MHLSFWGFILGLPLLYMVLGPRIDTENYENRNMTERPVFSISGIDTYPIQYEAYYNDNFPFRSKLITANSRISYQIFNEGIGSTVIGKNGWLFYNSEASADGRNIEQFKGTALFSDAELAQVEVLESYLPKQLSDSEIEEEVKKIIAQTGASSMKEMGKVMGIASKQMAGRAEGGKISAVVKKLLS